MSAKTKKRFTDWDGSTAERKYTISDYTFPKGNAPEIQLARIERLSFDESYMHIHLDDGRILSVPLAWIPTVRDGSQEERMKYILSEERLSMHWIPPECAINEDLRLSDYLHF